MKSLLAAYGQLSDDLCNSMFLLFSDSEWLVNIYQLCVKGMVTAKICFLCPFSCQHCRVFTPPAWCMVQPGSSASCWAGWKFPPYAYDVGQKGGPKHYWAFHYPPTASSHTARCCSLRYYPAAQNIHRVCPGCSMLSLTHRNWTIRKIGHYECLKPPEGIGTSHEVTFTGRHGVQNERGWWVSLTASSSCSLDRSQMCPKNLIRIMPCQEYVDYRV